MAVKISEAILGLLGGLGVFLVAMKMLSSNIETLAGTRLKKMFEKIGKSKFLGVGIGTAATAIIQSSGAVSVMVIGFVNAGLMNLLQATTIIFGANIGTTITAQIVAFGLIGTETVSINVIFGAFTGIGAFILLFSKKDKLKKIGGLIAGFGMIFIGLNLMKHSMDIFTEMQGLINFLAILNNPILLVVIGALLTAVLQSSSAMTGLVITMVTSGLLSLDQGIFLTFGSNIGSCVVALIACIGASTNAKRTAFIHFNFNVIGVVIFMFISLFMKIGGTSFALVLESIFPDVLPIQLAMMHTFFNITNVLIMLPFAKVFVKVTEKIIPDKKPGDKKAFDRMLARILEKRQAKSNIKTDFDTKLEALIEKRQNKFKLKKGQEIPSLFYIDNNFLSTPPIAVSQLKKEIVDMANRSIENFNLSIDAITKLDFTQKSLFEKNEKTLNFQNKEIVKFMVRLSKENITAKDHRFIGTAHHTVMDLERIGDYSENIIEYAETLFENQEYVSEYALNEILDMKKQINDLYETTFDMFENQSSYNLEKAYAIEETIDMLDEKMAHNHVERLKNGECTAETGALYLSFASNAERIGDHLINIAESVKKFENKGFNIKKNNK